MALWNAKGIRKLASLIGKPIDIDDNARQVKRLKYARALVEVKANAIFRKNIRAKDDQGRTCVRGGI